jgi:hypothetical protein
VAVHAQRLYFFNQFLILVAAACTGFCDLAAHIRKEIVREALLCHVELFVRIVCVSEYSNTDDVSLSCWGMRVAKMTEFRTFF